MIAVFALVFFTGDRSASPKLGIDLQGGTRVTLVPQGEEPTADQLNQARSILENRVNGMGVSDASVVADGNTLVITVPGEDTSEARAVGQTSQLYFRPVVGGGTPVVAEVPSLAGELANQWVEQGVITPEEAQEAVSLVIGAVNDANQATAEAQVPEGEEAPVVDPVEEPEITATPLPVPENSIEAGERRGQVTEMLREHRQSADPTVQFVTQALMRCGPEENDPLQGTDDPTQPLLACDPSTGQVMLLGPVPLLVGETDEQDGQRLTGNEIDTNRPITGGFNPQTGQMEISFSFKSGSGEQGAATWSQLTTDYLQQQVAITLDSQVISAPVIQSPTPVGSATSITGEFTQEEAQDLANNLRYGALPLSFAGEDGESGGTAETVPPSLGAAAMEAALIAGLVGLALVAIFVFAYYRVFGFVSLITLVAAGALLYGSLVLLGRWIGYTLDLSGMAGIVIGIGTTADSFVVLYERIKDEIREGRTFRSAVPRGWDRAKRTIVTGNIVTLLAAVIIYLLAVGEVKGFAFTLGLTTVFDLLVTFMITGPLMILASRKQFFAKRWVNGMGESFEFADNERLNQPAVTTAASTTAAVTTAAVTTAASTTTTPADAGVAVTGGAAPADSGAGETTDTAAPVNRDEEK
ncbi:protein translocase subunit SecD [Corynebacterium sp. A21]|uniref:protein translocase subunit SecD n=1 Tax=Corynebacterium sp. A21 TaxID=3457318 RepID=UPI003FD4A758